MSKRKKGTRGANKKSSSTEQTALLDISEAAMRDAALLGFAGLADGEVLCNDNSSSVDATLLQTDLAARQLEHCLESWNYLSHATWAMLNGQDNQAIHMAYYAEIRAANSLFAATGIAVRNVSYYLSSSRERIDVKIQTHKFIRGLWPNWCKRADAKAAFSELTIAPSVTLRDLIEAMLLSENSTQQNLNNWGYELLHFTEDHYSRNRASYQPTMVYEGIPPLDNKKHAKTVASAWELLLPGGVTGQMQFEMSYARYLLHSYCLNKAPSDELQQKKEAQIILNRLIERTGSSKQLIEQLIPFTTQAGFRIFELATDQETKAENIYARALILARLAAFKLQNNIKQSRCRQALQWVKRWLVEHAILNAEDELEEMVYSANDYAAAAENISDLPLRRTWQTNTAYEAALACRMNTGLCWAFDHSP